ncbi:Multidrug resistance-associated protein 9, partial [Stegodyphus mimosarum]
MVNTIASHGIRTLPTCIRNIVNGMVAISRLQALLQLEEKENYTVVPNRLDIAINVSNATLTWEQMIPNISQKGLKSKKGEVNLIIAENEKNVPEEISPKTALVSTLQSETGLPPVLTDISFSLLKGKLIGVCGPYGSGK